MAYTPPPGHDVELLFDLLGDTRDYQPPLGSNVMLWFGAELTRIYADPFDALLLGSHSIRNNQRFILASGFDESVVGDHTVEDDSIKAFGIFPPIARDAADVPLLGKYNFGWHTVAIGALRILPTGFDESAFGTHAVYTTTQSLFPAGIDGEAFGATVVVGARMLAPSGYAAEAIGSHTIESRNKYVYPAGIAAIAFGTTEIQGPRLLRPSGISQATVGTALVDFAIRNARDVTLGDTSAIGSHSIADTRQWIEPAPMAEQGEQMGAPVIGFDGYQVIFGATAGTSHDVSESHALYNANARRVYPRVWGALAQSAVGTPRITPHTIYATGINGGSFGTAWISNFIRYLNTTGTDFARVGTAKIENWIRYVEPTGWDRSVVCNDFGYIDEDGIYFHVRNALAGMALPDGIDESGVGTPSLRYNLC